MKFERTETMGWQNAIYGARNPMNSWDRSDTKNFSPQGVPLEIGENDLKLLKTLAVSGNDHSKWLRMIHVQVQITAPIYWWKEMDTYKVGTVANSTSTMHKILSAPITQECFEIELSDRTVEHLETLRTLVLSCKNSGAEATSKNFWKQLIAELPQGFLQSRMWDTNYQVLRTIAHSQRKTHKLTEWRNDFFDWMRTLPFAEDFIFSDRESSK